MSRPFCDWIRFHGVRTPERVAVRDLDSGRTLDYGTLDARASRAANLFGAYAGLRAGDRIAVLAHNHGEIFELQYACLRSGAVLVPLNWRLTDHELLSICADAEPRMLIADEACLERAAHLAAEIDIAPPIMFGAADSPYEQLLASASDSHAIAAPEADAPSLLLYTSGTTGRPKGVIVTPRMLVANATNTSIAAEMGPDSRGLTFLPTFHIGGFTSYANPLFQRGASTCITRRYNPEEFLRIHTSAELGITHSGGVPAQFAPLIGMPGFGRADFTRLRFVAIGGATVPDSVVSAYRERGLVLRNCWGMTETAGFGTAMPQTGAERHPGSCGLALPNTELSLRDPGGAEVGADEVGELCIRGEMVTPGYWRQPEATAASRHGTWFRTGDAARVDADGFHWIVDRWKDMYISGGENVYPAEVEREIAMLPEVAEVAVVGVPDPRWGEVGCAWIVTRGGALVTESVVASHCQHRLASYKRPRHVRFVADLPRNASGKVLKRALQQRFAAAGSSP